MASPVDSSQPKVPDESEYDWENFKKKFGRNYGSEEEEMKRQAIFNENVAKIKEHNDMFMKGKTTYTQGVNDFTDKNPEELKHLTGFLRPEKK